LWDTKNEKAIGMPFRGHQTWVTSVAFSVDGQRIISASIDGTLRLWDKASAKSTDAQVVHSSILRPLGVNVDALIGRWSHAQIDPIGETCRSLRTHQSLINPTTDIEQEARKTCQRWGWR
jgi:WD40 repeat protein